jgi:hypothetical protein
MTAQKELSQKEAMRKKSARAFVCEASIRALFFQCPQRLHSVATRGCQKLDGLDFKWHSATNS